MSAVCQAFATTADAGTPLDRTAAGATRAFPLMKMASSALVN